MEQRLPSVNPPRWRALFYIPVLWLSLGIAVGFLIAASIGEHGSVIFLLGGAAMGASGTVAHCLLFLVPLFRRTTEVRQVLLLWVSSVTLFTLYLLANWTVSGVSVPATAEFFTALAYVAAPVLPGAAVVNRVIRRVAAAA